MTTPVYFKIAKGSKYDPLQLTGVHATRVDYLNLDDGSKVGRLSATSAAARKTLEAQAGITVLPPLHRPVKSEHVKAFGYCGATDADTAWDIAEKLYETHKMFYFHPEESAE